MPEDYKVPSSYHQVKYTNNFYHRYPPLKNKKVIAYSTLVILVFYTALYLTSGTTALTLQFTGLASKIMNKVRVERKARIFSEQLDNSSMIITTSNTNTLLVIDPDNNHEGETIDGIRYYELSDVKRGVLTDNSGLLTHSLQIIKPYSGFYTLTLGCRDAGTFSVTITISDITGNQNKTLSRSFTCTDKASTSFQLEYNKHEFDRSHLLIP